MNLEKAMIGKMDYVLEAKLESIDMGRNYIETFSTGTYGSRFIETDRRAEVSISFDYEKALEMGDNFALYYKKALFCFCFCVAQELEISQVRMIGTMCCIGEISANQDLRVGSWTGSNYLVSVYSTKTCAWLIKLYRELNCSNGSKFIRNYGIRLSEILDESLTGEIESAFKQWKVDQELINENRTDDELDRMYNPEKYEHEEYADAYYD